jgi:DNA-binding response OmpR family regulator
MDSATHVSILVVEADTREAQAIARQLTADGFAVELARTAAHARALASNNTPGLALLGSLDAPRGALALLEEIRHTGQRQAPWDRSLPTIVLGRGTQGLDMLRAFEAGADDFLVGSARYVELRARMRALLRRAERPAPPQRLLRAGSLELDARNRTVLVEGRAVDLRRLEFQLLAHLALEPERVFSKQELLRDVWGYRSCAASRTVDTHASRLRRKLELDCDSRWVINVWGVGYRLM